MGRFLAPLLLATALACAGCARGMRLMEPAESRPALAHLLESTPTRQQVETALGAPEMVFEGGRIAVWYLGKDQRPVWPGSYRDPVARAKRIQHHLVAVFDAVGRVERHSLIRVR